MSVSVSPVIILAACPRCFNGFCPMHGGIDSSMDPNNQVLTRDEKMDGFQEVAPHWVLYGGKALVR